VLPAAGPWGDPLPAALAPAARVIDRTQACRESMPPTDRQQLRASRQPPGCSMSCCCWAAEPAATAPAQISVNQPWCCTSQGSWWRPSWTCFPFPLNRPSSGCSLNRADLRQEQAMPVCSRRRRSGQDVVANRGLLTANRDGLPGCLDGSTEVAAQQHGRNLGEWLPRCTFRPPCSPAPHRGRAARKLLQDLANGQLKLLGRTTLASKPVAVRPAWPGWWSMNSTASACASATACLARDQPSAQRCPATRFRATLALSRAWRIWR